MMMTKEEVIDAIIERYKGFENKSTLGIYDCCHGLDCYNCPFGGAPCDEDIAMSLLDRLVKDEEKKETNLEHFKGNVAFDKENGIVLINLINRWKNNYSNDKDVDVIDWFLSPYEEPKPKYKLSKFEYDLLEYHSDSKYGIRDFWILEHMQDKGYFKDIPTDVPIRDILENCEVVEE